MQLSKTKLRQITKLLHRKGRDETDTFLVEGIQVVEEAIKAQAVQLLLVDDPAKHQNLVAQVTPDKVFTLEPSAVRTLAQTVTSQGIFAVCQKPSAKLNFDTAKLVVICAQVRDPGNAGTVIRCADAFGADAVILTRGSVELTNPKTVRATAGSIFHLPIITSMDLVDAIGAVKTAGMQVLAADGAGTSLDQMQDELARPTAWLMGNEAWGLPTEEISYADQVVGIPMWGKAESLNLSTAAAICLYTTAAAQRGQS